MSILRAALSYGLRRAVEPGEGKALVVFGIRGHLIAQHAYCQSFTQQEALLIIGAIMHPGKIACDADITREFVCFVAERHLGCVRTAVGQEFRSVIAWHDRSGNDEAFVEEPLQDSHTRARDNSVSLCVGGMLRATLTVLKREQISVVAGEDLSYRL